MMILSLVTGIMSLKAAPEMTGSMAGPEMIFILSNIMAAMIQYMNLIRVT